MFTRNFYNILARSIFNTTNKSPVTLYDGTQSTVSYTISNIYNTIKTWGTSMNGTGFQIGYGTTPPTLDDYKLESRHYTSSALSYVCGYVEELTDDGYSMTVTYTLTNTSSDIMTISEYGIMYSNTCLIYREVLSEPLVLEPAEVGQIQVTFDFPFHLS